MFRSAKRLNYSQTLPDLLMKLYSGGMLGIPHWGKFWMATLGLMEWEGVNAVLPELWYVNPPILYHL